MSVKGYVMQLQPFSVNDGDGIRTTIFLAGCALRCKWCSNPEGFRQQELVGWYQRKCIGCSACAAVCPQGIGVDLHAERERCLACGKCVAACPTGARSQLVRLMEADEVLRQLRRDKIFYSFSGGGVTFSGGECTGQPEMLDYLSSELYDMGYSLAMETCGNFDFPKVRSSLERMDLIFMDIKHMDAAKHRYFTGISNERILENVKQLNEVPAQVVIRIPTIVGVNSDEGNIRATAAFVHKALPKARMELLLYHKFGTIKYEALALPYEHEDFQRPTKEQLERLKKIIRDEGVTLADFT